MGRRLTFFAFALVLIVIGGEIWIPGALESRFARGLGKAVDHVGQVAVQLEAFPALAMVFGRFDVVRVDARGVEAGGLKVHRVFVEATKVRLDLRELLARKIKLESLEHADMTVVLTEEALNDYFRKKADIFRIFKLELDRGKASILGDIRLVGGDLHLTIDGRFVVEGKARVRYQIERFTVQNVAVPKPLRDILSSNLDLSLNLGDWGDWPFPVNIRDVRVEDEILYIFGESP